MKGDFSRHTFVAGKHYAGVLAQQGRVLMDADVNEAGEILRHRDESTTADVLGASGTPISAPGFTIAVQNAKDLLIGPGHYYVDGILCENEQPVSYSAQPDFPGAADLLAALTAAKASVGLVYLDVWRRFISVIEDSALQETALGGPDTTTRLKTVWQVKMLPLPAATAATAACGDPALTNLPTLSSGTMNARLTPPSGPSGLCQLAPSSGFLGAENQLYRIEIQGGGDRTAATIKWSRDNGSVATAVTKIDSSITANTLTVLDTGPDAVRGFADGQWVELADDASVLGGSAHPLVQIDHVFADQEKITLKTAPAGVGSGTHTLARRWDVGDTVALAGGAALPTDFSSGIPMNQTDGAWITLENGVQITFAAGQYNVGDYWMVTARATGDNLAVGSIEWPGVTGPNVAGQPQPPLGVKHHHGPLALVQVAGGALTLLRDCRSLFPAATELTGLYYLGGDGQEGAGGQVLPQPLQVGVANGRWPVPNSQVLFTAHQGSLANGTSTGASLTVTTDAQGVAAVNWTLDPTTPSQTVTAALQNGTSLPIHFSAEIDQLPAIHVIRVTAGGVLRNDTKIQLPDLLRGIQVLCSDPVAPVSINRATCTVTVEVPFFQRNPNVTFISQILIGFQPLVLLSTANTDGPLITWHAAEPAALTAFLSPLIDQTPDKQVLAHFTLKGNFIWNQQKQEIHLDGSTLGVPRSDTSPPGTDIVLPSGDKRRASTFEMWFWITNPPAAALASLTLAPTSITVAVGAVGTVQATVTLTGPAPTGGASVNFSTNHPEIAQFVNAAIAVPAGATQTTMPININVGNMPAPTTVQINATFNNVTQSASLDVKR